MKKIRMGIAFIRALWLRFWLRLFYGKRVVFGAKCFVQKGAQIRVSGKGKLHVKNAVRFGQNALVSALKEGTIVLEKGACVGANNMLVCHEGITVGENTIFAPNVLVYDHDHTFSAETGVDKRNFKTAPVSIGKNCWIGANVTILRGTVIEDNCVVGAGSVLKGHYPKGSLIVQKRETEIKDLYRG